MATDLQQPMEPGHGPWPIDAVEVFSGSGASRGAAAGRFSLCAEHDRQLGGGSPLSSLMVAKD
jgi:hypothetical protein